MLFCYIFPGIFPAGSTSLFYLLSDCSVISNVYCSDTNGGDPPLFCLSIGGGLVSPLASRFHLHLKQVFAPPSFYDKVAFLHSFLGESTAVRIDFPQNIQHKDRGFFGGKLNGHVMCLFASPIRWPCRNPNQEAVSHLL